MDPSTLKILQGAAGAAGGDPIGVEDVFSIRISNSTQPQTNADNRKVVNNIDLSSEGGLIWSKCREVSTGHVFVDTERGKFKY